MKMKITGFLVLVLCLTMAVLTSTGMINRLVAACTVVHVTPEDVSRQPENTPPANHWVFYTRNAGDGGFRVGPATPPIGVGSFEISTPGGSDKGYLFNYDHIGTPLAAINNISYSTFRSAGNLQQVTALNIEVDVNGSAPGGFTTLVFEPVYNTAQGPVVSGQWQNWDAYAGGTARWWSTKDIPGVCAFNCFVSWADIVAANPDAVIVGGFGINQGSGNPNLVAATDALTFGTNNDYCVTYNFDPYVVATDKNACKGNGWRGLRRADGSPFKNQGDCIQYVNTGK